MKWTDQAYSSGGHVGRVWLMAVAALIAWCVACKAAAQPMLTPQKQVTPAADRPEARADAKRIVLANGVTIELLTRGEEFIGVGQIQIDGVIVRRGDRPWTVHCVSPQLLAQDLIGRPMPPMHERVTLASVRLHDDGLGADIVTDLHMWQQPTDRLTWIIRGHQELWRGLRSNGFSYAFRFQSSKRLVHQIREEGSWTLGPSVEGLLSIDQNESYGRQSWALLIEKDTIIKGWSFPAQRQWPEGRFSVGGLIDYLATADHALMRYLDQPALTYKEIWRPAGSAELLAREWYPTAAARRFETPAMHVRIFYEGGVNGWLDATDWVKQRYVEQSGIEPTPLLPGVITNLASMTTDAMGKEYDSRTEPEPYVDWLVEQGIRRTWTWCRWKTAWTAWDSLTEAQQREIETGLSHAVMRLEWDDAVIDLDRLKRLVEYGNQRGIESMLWVPGGHLSKVSPLRSEHPAWVVKGMNGSPYTYVYPDIGGNFYPAGYGRYMLQAIQNAREMIPFTAIWLDSFQVFGLDVINYARPEWPNQFDAAVDFIRQARRNGLHVGTECAFPLALPASTSLYRVKELDGREFLAYGVSQHFGGAEPVVSPQMYFKLVAWKGPPLLRDVQWREVPELARLGAYVNHAYLALRDVMHRARFLDNGVGVLWLDEQDRPAAFYAFADGSIQLPVSAVEVLSGQEAPSSAGAVEVQAYQAYKLTPR